VDRWQGVPHARRAEEHRGRGEAAGASITDYEAASASYAKARNRRIRDYINETRAAGPK